MVKQFSGALSSNRGILALAAFLLLALSLIIYFSLFWKVISPGKGGKLSILDAVEVHIPPDGLDSRSRVKLAEHEFDTPEELKSGAMELLPKGLYIDLRGSGLIKPMAIEIHVPDGWTGDGIYACRWESSKKSIVRVHGDIVENTLQFFTRVPGFWHACKIKEGLSLPDKEIAGVKAVTRAVFNLDEDPWNLVEKFHNTYKSYAKKLAGEARSEPGTIAPPEENSIGLGRLVKVGDDSVIIAVSNLPLLGGAQDRFERAVADKSGGWIKDDELAFKAFVTENANYALKGLELDSLVKIFRESSSRIISMRPFADAAVDAEALKAGDRSRASALVARMEMISFAEKLSKASELIENFQDTEWTYENRAILFMLLSDIAMRSKPLNTFADAVFPGYGENLELDKLRDEPALRHVANLWTLNDHARKVTSPIKRIGLDARDGLPEDDEFASLLFDACMGEMENEGPMLTYFTHVRAVREEYLPFAGEYASVRYAFRNMRRSFGSITEIMDTLKAAFKEKEYGPIQDMCIGSVTFGIAGCSEESLECGEIEERLTSEDKIDWGSGEDKPDCPNIKASIKHLFLGPGMLPKYIKMRPRTIIRSNKISLTLSLPYHEGTILKFRLNLIKHPKEGYLLKKVEYLMDF